MWFFLRIFDAIVRSTDIKRAMNGSGKSVTRDDGFLCSTNLLRMMAFFEHFWPFCGGDVWTNVGGLLELLCFFFFQSWNDFACSIQLQLLYI